MIFLQIISTQHYKLKNVPLIYRLSSGAFSLTEETEEKEWQWIFLTLPCKSFLTQMVLGFSKWAEKVFQKKKCK